MVRLRTPINTYYSLSYWTLFIWSRWYDIRAGSISTLFRYVTVELSYYCQVSSLAVSLQSLRTSYPTDSRLKRNGGGAWKIVNASWSGRLSVSAVLLVRDDSFDSSTSLVFLLLDASHRVLWFLFISRRLLFRPDSSNCNSKPLLFRVYSIVVNIYYRCVDLRISSPRIESTIKNLIG